MLKNSDIAPFLCMHTKLATAKQATSDEMAFSLIRSVALSKANEFSSSNIGLVKDLESWSKAHPGVGSWHEMDKKIYRDLYQGKSIFERLKHERSQRFELVNHKAAFEDWMERLGEFYSNLVLDVFYGVLLNEVHCCACGSDSYYFSMFSGIEADTSYYLPLLGKDNIVKIGRLIAHSFAPGYEESCYCFKCRENMFQKYVKKIYRPPEVLLVSFYENKMPNNLFVKLETSGLDLSEFTFRGYQNETLYNLRGLINKEPSHKQPEIKRAAFRTKPLSEFEEFANLEVSLLEKSRMSELVFYCDFSRHWMQLNRTGLEKSIHPETLQGSNSLSFCLYELAN